MVCKNCEAALEQGTEFCPFCGAKVADANSVVCPKCGAEMPEDAMFCAVCGTPLEKGKFHAESAKKRGIEKKAGLGKAILAVVMITLVVGGVAFCVKVLKGERSAERSYISQRNESAGVSETSPEQVLEPNLDTIQAPDITTFHTSKKETHQNYMSFLDDSSDVLWYFEQIGLDASDLSELRYYGMIDGIDTIIQYKLSGSDKYEYILFPVNTLSAMYYGHFEYLLEFYSLSPIAYPGYEKVFLLQCQDRLYKTIFRDKYIILDADGRIEKEFWESTFSEYSGTGAHNPYNYETRYGYSVIMFEYNENGYIETAKEYTTEDNVNTILNGMENPSTFVHNYHYFYNENHLEEVDKQGFTEDGTPTTGSDMRFVFLYNDQGERSEIEIYEMTPEDNLWEYAEYLSHRITIERDSNGRINSTFLEDGLHSGIYYWIYADYFKRLIVVNESTYNTEFSESYILDYYKYGIVPEMD